MKKINICLASLLSLLFFSCTEDFTVDTSLQTNPQESILKPTDITVTPLAVAPVDYNQVDSLLEIPVGTVTVKDGCMPSNSYIQSVVEFSTTSDFAKTIEIAADSMSESTTIRVRVDKLQESLYENLYRKNEQTTVYLRSYLKVVTNSTSEATVVDDNTNKYYYDLGSFKYTPAYHQQSPEYYIVGRQNSWSMSKLSAFYPTSMTTISYTSYFTGAWDCRIATPANAAAGIWDHDFGAATNGCTDPTGTLKEDCNNCIASPEAGYYTLTADMDAMTYTWTKVEGTPVSYEQIGIVGAGDDWDNDIYLTKVAGSSELAGNDTHNWSALNVELKAATWGMKFRANHGWDTSWGGFTPTSTGSACFGTAVLGGGNITGIEAGTYNIYFNDITGQCFFVKLN